MSNRNNRPSTTARSGVDVSPGKDPEELSVLSLLDALVDRVISLDAQLGCLASRLAPIRHPIVPQNLSAPSTHGSTPPDVSKPHVRAVLDRVLSDMEALSNNVRCLTDAIDL